MSADLHPGSRRRAMLAYFSSIALASTGYIALVTVTPLVAEDLLASPRWSGLPSAIAVVGTALGTTLLARFMASRGRRFGLVLGYAVAAVSASLILLALLRQSFSLLIVGMFCLGSGYGASRLTRYAAADLYPESRRASAISWIIWAGTVGSVVGPNLLEPTKRFVERFQFPAAMGAYGMTLFGMVGAALVLRFAVPDAVGAMNFGDESRARSASDDRVAEDWRLALRVALVALLVSQATMLLIMTMTPIELRSRGAGFAFIGFVMSAHTLGMYALAPITGWLADKLGRAPIIVAGSLMLSTAGLVAATSEGSRYQLAIALFLLGLGWNFGFVAGSALLTDRVPIELRVRIQGTTDSIVWMTAALATVGSGLLMSQIQYRGLGYVGAVFALLPTLAVALYKFAGRTASPAPASGQS